MHAVAHSGALAATVGERLKMITKKVILSYHAGSLNRSISDVNRKKFDDTFSLPKLIIRPIDWVSEP